MEKRSRSASGERIHRSRPQIPPRYRVSSTAVHARIAYSALKTTTEKTSNRQL